MEQTYINYAFLFIVIEGQPNEKLHSSRTVEKSYFHKVSSNIFLMSHARETKSKLNWRRK